MAVLQIFKSGEIAFYIIGISDDKWLQMKISNLLFYDLPRRTLVAFSLHFYHFLECLAQISQHPRSQPGRLKKMHLLSAKCNVMFQKIFIPLLQKAFWFLSQNKGQPRSDQVSKLPVG